MPLEQEKKEKRTSRQNKAIHAYLTLVAHELQNQGQTIQGVVKKIDFAEVVPTPQSIKEVLWRPIQEVVVGKKSTTELTTAEVNKVYDIISMFLSKQFGISLPFPSQEETLEYLQSYEQP